MLRRIVVLFLALGLLAPVVALAPPELGGPSVAGAHPSCDHTRIRLFEGLNRTGDAVDICGNWSDLNTLGHNYTGNCDSHPFGDNSWDDCVSSIQIIQNDHNYCSFLWGNPSGIPPLLEGGRRAVGYWSNLDGGEDNTATSVTWSTTSTGVCPTNG